MSIQTVAAVSDAPLASNGRLMSVDQAVAVETVATSGRVLDVLVGPAGTGKTVAMAARGPHGETEHGPGSVIGLAPSAATAQVLADDLDVPTENTAVDSPRHAATVALSDARSLRIVRSAMGTRTGVGTYVCTLLLSYVPGWRRPRRLINIAEAAPRGM